MKMTAHASRTAQSSLASARESLAALVRSTLRGPRGDSRVIRLQVRVPHTEYPQSFVSWLQEQTASTRIYWRSRAGDFEAAGIGAAHVVAAEGVFDLAEVFDRMALRDAAPNSNLRYFGGFRFDRANEANERWKPFGACRFILPRIELTRHKNEVFLACTLMQSDISGREDACHEALALLDAMSSIRSSSTPALSVAPVREDRPDATEWRDLVEQALAAIEDGTFEKVVVARESRFRLEQTPNLVAVFARLAARAHHTARNAYRFCFQVDENAAFFGASPELLYRRAGASVETEAVAGTRPRGDSDENDERLAEDLLHNDKERREHAIVFDALRAAMDALCEDVHADAEPRLMKLPTCQHLRARIRGTLSRAANDAELLRALHPTPAVGGYPSDAALSWLRSHEPFDRGWYAGPVGWLARDAAEFAVGIRSGLVSDDTLSLYSGAGIVAGSTPEKEWAEIENKMSAFADALPDRENDDA